MRYATFLHDRVRHAFNLNVTTTIWAVYRGERLYGYRIRIGERGRVIGCALNLVMAYRLAGWDHGMWPDSPLFTEGAAA